MHETDAEPFNLETVTQLFKDSLVDDDDVSLSLYIEAYKEFSKLFHKLGMLFSFVESDVRDKRHILHNLHEGDEPNYASVKSMISFEIDATTGKPSAEGSRTLLRLHRALEFLRLFVERVNGATDADNISLVFRSSYDETLSRYHGFFIRKAVGFASHAIPTRAHLASIIFAHGETPTDDEQSRISHDFLEASGLVYDRIQSIYAEGQLLELP